VKSVHEGLQKPILCRLATGKLEVEIKSDPPGEKK
jgi:hypothetical protein